MLNLREEPVVDFVLLAEFDIDSGSTLRYQYPNPIENYKDDWLAENMLPEGMHNREHDWTYLFLNRDKAQLNEHSWIYPLHPSFEDNSSNRFLYGLNLVRTKYDSNVRRGAEVKALALFSRYPFIEIFKAPLIIALDQYFESPSIDILQQLYLALNTLQISKISHPKYLQQQLMRRNSSTLHFHDSNNSNKNFLPYQWLHKDTFQLQGTKIPITIPLYKTPDEVGETSFSLLIRTFGVATMKIYHAILMKQRVLFLGHNQSTVDLCQMVLTAINMISPPIANIIRRAYPYASLSDLTFLETKGYIAGVTNPMFFQRDNWWDLICVIDTLGSTGTIKTAEEKRSEDAVLKGKQLFITKSVTDINESLHESMDAKFIAIVISGIDARLGEDWVKGQFHDYTNTILQQAFDGGDSLSHDADSMTDSLRKVYHSNSYRANKLQQTSEVAAMPNHPWIWCHHNSDDNSSSSSSSNDDEITSSNAMNADTTATSQVTTTVPTKSQIPVTVDGGVGIILRQHIRKLQLVGNLPVMQIQAIFEDLDRYLRTEESYLALLTLLPESAGGITVIACGLFHEEDLIRTHAVRVLERMQSFPSISSLITDDLNPYLKVCYKKQLSILNGTEFDPDELMASYVVMSDTTSTTGDDPLPVVAPKPTQSDLPAASTMIVTKSDVIRNEKDDVDAFLDDVESFIRSGGSTHNNNGGGSSEVTSFVSSDIISFEDEI